MRDDFLFRGGLAELDPAVAHLIDLERERQARKLIMIPSESSTPEAVQEALGSCFASIYAEGYPNPETHWLTEGEILDYEHHLAHYRRYGDRRYYRGVEYADVVEALARRRCAEALATGAIGPEQIYVNVQPLSGAAANVAVQQALLKPGDTIMGMALAHGGHLTHGSPANLSGKLYNAVSYEVNQTSELLDYDEIEALALEHRPKMIIAGYTAYPRLPDWAKFRQIADRVGAYLLADIAHVAGMVVAGVFPTPLGYADVISFTTHKTLCGPRGACVVTTDKSLAGRIDRSVFPGLQGGPHVNKFASLAAALRLATTDQFVELQKQIVRNAKALARALVAQGLRVPCGGTDTHLLLLDCKTIEGQDGTPLMGHVTAAILDLIGIVTNKNTIPGDKSATRPSGIRLGTPWVTQRGLREEEMDRIAVIIARTMHAIEPFRYAGVRGPIYRGKVDFDELEALREEVASLASKAGIDFAPVCSGYPHHCILPELRPRDEAFSLLEVEGNSAAAFVEQLGPEDIHDLPQGESWRLIHLSERDGSTMSAALVARPGFGNSRFHLIIPSTNGRRVVAWLRHLSDGFVGFDDSDPWAKLPGPTVVRELGPVDRSIPELAALGPDSEHAEPLPQVAYKPYFVGLSSRGTADLRDEPLPTFEWTEPQTGDLQRTPLIDWHVANGAKMAPFAGWRMPLWYSSIGDEHRAVRGAAGLFDVSHMGLFDVSGSHAAYFLNLVLTNDVDALRPGESQYSYLLAPDGSVIDDVMVYRVTPSRFLVVVNAANAEKDWEWLNGVNEREICIDHDRPWARSSFRADLRNLHDPQEPYSWQSDLALQGPRSLDILLALVDAAAPSSATAEIRARLMNLPRGGVIEAHIPSNLAPGGIFDLFIARTGYTGERRGYELFVHPDVLGTLWETLLEVGAPSGLVPVGLAARDSLRIEAGLPLYGHELAGPLDLRPDDAGYEGFVKLHKPFFVGRRAYIDHNKERRMQVARFQISEKGVRVPKQRDVITDDRGRVIGEVTSCAIDTEGYLVGMAQLDRRHSAIGTEVFVFPHPTREAWEKPYADLELGDRLVVHSEAKIVRRFRRR